MSIKKIISVFCTSVISLNIGVPMFAYSLTDSHTALNDTFEVRVSKDTSTDKLMNIDLGNEKISLSLGQKFFDSEDCKTEETNKSKKLFKGQTQQIKNVLPDVSVRYKKQERGLKEDFILHSRAAQNVFNLNYDIGSLQAWQTDEQNILLIDENGNIKTIISAPYMTDNKGACSKDVSLKISNQNGNMLSVKLTADYSWLQSDDREYPVEVDPRYDTLPTKSMKKGDNDEQVALLKNMLFEAGIGAGVSMHETKRDLRNNTFSSITEKFVIAFQREMDLTPTGVADANTLGALRMHLERKEVLDTPEHTEQFLKRSETRSPSETKGFFASMANFFGRVNVVDLLVTVGTAAVVVEISAFCAPVTAASITYMLVGGSAIGAAANGISEYAQQRSVGSNVDFGRVAIKAAGGAVKGLACAIPSAGVGVGGKALLFGGVAAAGTAENLSCTVKSTGFSGEALGDALINGTAQGLVSVPVAVLARGSVCLVKSKQSSNLSGKTKSVRIGGTQEVAEVAGGAGGGAAAKCVENSTSKDKGDKSSSTKGSTPETRKVSVESGSKNLTDVFKSRRIGENDISDKGAIDSTSHYIPRVSEKTAKSRNETSSSDAGVSSKEKALKNQNITGNIPSDNSKSVFNNKKHESPEGSLSAEMRDIKRFMDDQAYVDLKKPLDQVIEEKWKRTVEGAKALHTQFKTPQGLEMQKEIYRKDLEFVSGVRDFAQRNSLKLTPESKRKLEIFEKMARGEIKVREAAQRGDIASRRRLNYELGRNTIEVMNEQIQRYTEEFCRQFHSILANMYR